MYIHFLYAKIRAKKNAWCQLILTFIRKYSDYHTYEFRVSINTLVFDSVLQSYNNTKNTRGSYCIRENEQAERLLNRDEFELKFCGSSKPELWRFQAEPSWGTSIFELKPSWNFFKNYNQISKFSTSIMIITNSNQLYDHLYEFM